MNNQHSNRIMEQMIQEAFSSDDLHIVVPPLSAKARNVILRRKKTAPLHFGFLETFMTFISVQLKVVHVGVTMLLLCGGIIYLNDSSYDNTGAADFSDFNTYRSISHNTISVNSTTMLTSIPTLVIRN